MNIEKKREGNEFTVELQGRVDTTTAPDLEKFLEENLGDAKSLVLDMAGLEYISSAGLRVLLNTQKKMNRVGKMTVKNVNEVVMEVFEVTGFSDILTIE